MSDATPETSRGARSEGEDSISDLKKDTKLRYCARCRNHESDLKELKGHKEFCPWRNCFCEPCLKTVIRQKLMKDQTAARRKRDLMKKRAKAGLPLVVPPAAGVNTLKTAASTCVLPPQTAAAPVAFTPPARTKEVSWEAITELMNMFDFNVNTSCLLYLILKYLSNNVKEARNIILSGT